MNKAVPVAIGLVVIAILAVEGKWNALWAAIKGGSGPATAGKQGNLTTATVGLTVMGDSSLPGIPMFPTGTAAAGNSVAQTLANRVYAVEHGTDPVLNEYYYNHAATNDPQLNANWQSFIACYLHGDDIHVCAAKWLPKG